ncbi:unnamed protein product [Arabidopsis halleri]
MESKSIVEALKNKGITGIGAARFCWGGEFGFLVPISRLKDIGCIPERKQRRQWKGIRLNVYGT